MTNRLLKRTARATGAPKAIAKNASAPVTVAQAASAPRRRGGVAKQSPAANGHLVDLASHFNLRSGPGYYNESGKVALLRRAKSGPHDELLIDFSQPEVAMQLRLADRDLFRGPWKFQVSADGQLLAPVGPWQEVCWHTDWDGDYLEIEQSLSGGWLLQRQMFLARDDKFLFVADALIGGGRTAAGTTGSAQLDTAKPPANPPAKPPADLQAQLTLPLAAGAALQPVPETREARMTIDGKPRATVLPLALPEWRAEFCHASLTSAGGHLQLEQHTAGRNLYSPLFFDLDPARQKLPLTWRRLTVAESLRTVSRDEAVGYRVQIGRRQWLVYRTLDPCGNRSVLGLNTVTDFSLRRFLPHGRTESLVEVE